MITPTFTAFINNITTILSIHITISSRTTAINARNSSIIRTSSVRKTTYHVHHLNNKSQKYKIASLFVTKAPTEQEPRKTVPTTRHNTKSGQMRKQDFKSAKQIIIHNRKIKNKNVIMQKTIKTQKLLKTYASSIIITFLNIDHSVHRTQDNYIFSASPDVPCHETNTG